MKPIESRIQFYRQDMMKRLDQELTPFSVGTVTDLAYYNWYLQLEEIRKYLTQIIVNFNPSWEHPYLLNGHRIDHHIYGYIAPLELYRKGFLGEIRTPAEQISFLSQQFKEHGIRFIYAALPCKKAVYPEIILPSELYVRGETPGLIPQWRHMVRDLILHGVEVVDLYPYFLAYAENNRLFSLGHDVSCTGAALIGNILGTYLMDTTENITFPQYQELFKVNPCSVKEDNNEFQTEQVLYNSISDSKPYTGTEISAKIGIFGNCNLQKYRGYGIDITSQLSNVLSYPVSYLGRLLPFDSSGAYELAEAPDGAFAGKKIIIYLGFPSAAFVRSPHINDTWATRAIPERCFNT